MSASSSRSETKTESGGPSLTEQQEKLNFVYANLFCPNDPPYSAGKNGPKPGMSAEEYQEMMKQFRPRPSRFKFTGKRVQVAGQVIYGISFNHYKRFGDSDLVATVSGNVVTVYEAKPNGRMRVLKKFPDNSPKDPQEHFYCCAWGDEGDDFILAAGGENGHIRVIKMGPKFLGNEEHKTFPGHGRAINHLVFHPTLRGLLVSASKDKSLRLWNYQTNVLVAIFKGFKGHRDEVLGADIRDDYLVSCGMDHAIKVWDLGKKEIASRIEAAYGYEPMQLFAGKEVYVGFPTWEEMFPIYSTREIHTNYVDCVQWFGDLIVSKACQNEIVVWKAGNSPLGKEATLPATLERKTQGSTIVSILDIEDCLIWYMRFAIDPTMRNLALGNTNGKLYLYDLEDRDPRDIEFHILTHPRCKSLIRQATFSADGNILMYCCENGTIWRWDSRPAPTKRSTPSRNKRRKTSDLDIATETEGLETINTTNGVETNGLDIPMETTTTATNGLDIPMENPTTATNGLDIPMENTTTATNGLDIPLETTTTATNGLDIPMENPTTATNGLDIPMENTTTTTNGFDIPMENTTTATNGLDIPMENTSTATNGLDIPMENTTTATNGLDNPM